MAFTTFWFVFVVLFFTSVLIAILDFRYIRLQYTAAHRELFRQTLADEAFRIALRNAQCKANGHNPEGREDGPRPS